MPDIRLTEVSRNGNRLNAAFRNEYSAEDKQLDYDQVIVETGTVRLDELYQALAAKSVNQGQVDIDSLLAEISSGQRPLCQGLSFTHNLTQCY